MISIVFDKKVILLATDTHRHTHTIKNFCLGAPRETGSAFHGAGPSQAKSRGSRRQYVCVRLRLSSERREWVANNKKGKLKYTFISQIINV